MAVTPPKKGRGWDLANTNIQEWIKLFQGVGVMKVYISIEKRYCGRFVNINPK
jgi:hypothetical protein